jgi:sucrose-6-phosphate hydrolase SacC (GH32 family)
VSEVTHACQHHVGSYHPETAHNTAQMLPPNTVPLIHPPTLSPLPPPKHPQGRQIVWSWCQEHPSPVSHDYAGCISTPRQLTLGVKHSSNTNVDTAAAAAAQPHQQHQGHPNTLQQQQQQNADGGLEVMLDGTAVSRSSSSSSGPEYYLIQRPLPELDRLSSGRGLRLKGIHLPPGLAWWVVVMQALLERQTLLAPCQRHPPTTTPA